MAKILNDAKVLPLENREVLLRELSGVFDTNRTDPVAQSFKGEIDKLKREIWSEQTRIRQIREEEDRPRREAIARQREEKDRMRREEIQKKVEAAKQESEKFFRAEVREMHEGSDNLFDQTKTVFYVTVSGGQGVLSQITRRNILALRNMAWGNNDSFFISEPLPEIQKTYNGFLLTTTDTRLVAFLRRAITEKKLLIPRLPIKN